MAASLAMGYFVVRLLSEAVTIIIFKIAQNFLVLVSFDDAILKHAV